MADTISNANRLALAAVISVVAAGGAYLVAKHYPPQGGVTFGTVAPAERYRSSQLQNGDVVLGDNSVPMLMQTDAFEVMVKNPSFRTLAADPGFRALAQNPTNARARADLDRLEDDADARRDRVRRLVAAALILAIATVGIVLFGGKSRRARATL